MTLLRRAPSPLRGSAIIAPNRIGRGPLPNPATGASGPTQGGTATAPSAHACWPRVSRGRGGDDSRRLRSCGPPVLTGCVLTGEARLGGRFAVEFPSPPALPPHH